MPRKGSNQVNISFPKDDKRKKLLDEITERYARLGISSSMIGRTLLSQRLELFTAGFLYDDPDSLNLLQLCISNSNPPSTNTLAQLRKYALAQGAESGQEDLYLKANDVVTTMLRIGLSLAHAGLDLEDNKTLGEFCETLRMPTLHKVLSVLVKCSPESLKVVADGIPELIAKAG